MVNGATTATQLSAADQLTRRAEEAKRFLEQGGTFFVIGRPNAVLPGVVGFEGFDRYSWLPAPRGGSWNPPHIRAGEGKTIRIAERPPRAEPGAARTPAPPLLPGRARPGLRNEGPRGAA